MVLLVLDEVDQLRTKDQSVLYTVFEWPAVQNSRLALVGIANSLDLINRVLPRLQVKAAYKPTLLHYPPYTKFQKFQKIQKFYTNSRTSWFEESGNQRSENRESRVARLAPKVWHLLAFKVLF